MITDKEAQTIQRKHIWCHYLMESQLSFKTQIIDITNKSLTEKKRKTFIFVVSCSCDRANRIQWL